jgi:carbonic anhydrase
MKLPFDDYPAPRGNVLLISCMDLRLLDDIVRFMDRDNLTNRYDQFILAGASLGPAKFDHWCEVLFEHLDAARKLHNVKDVYILEHRNCGAYREFLGEEEGSFTDSEEHQHREREIHQQYAQRLAKRILEHSDRKGYDLQVRCFLMDLRGNVELLDSATAA